MVRPTSRFVSSTDAALLHPAFIRRVFDGVDAGVDAAVPHARGHRQPLAAAYRVELADLVDSLLAAGLAKPAHLFERSRTRFVDDAWLLADPALAAVDPTLASLENLNDPEAYRLACAQPPPAVTVQGPGVAPSIVGAWTLGEAAASVGVPLGQATVGDSPRHAAPGFRLPRVIASRSTDSALPAEGQPRAARHAAVPSGRQRAPL